MILKIFKSDWGTSLSFGRSFSQNVKCIKLLNLTLLTKYELRYDLVVSSHRRDVNSNTFIDLSDRLRVTNKTENVNTEKVFNMKQKNISKIYFMWLQVQIRR